MPILTEAEVRTAKPKEKAYKIPDERGMHLLVTPAGGKLWRFRYRIAGVEKLLALGAYPDVPLKRARERREEARRLVAEGIDPSAQRRAEKASDVNTFEAIAREWLGLHPITGGGRFLFPALTTPMRPMSENTINGALRRLGYSADEMTGYGFRSMASTCLNEQGWHPDLIELQLAHAERNKVRAAYNRAARLAERRKMMQAWANYLDGLRAGANVVSIGTLRKASSA
jgi:integrase